MDSGMAEPVPKDIRLSAMKSVADPKDQGAALTFLWLSCGTLDIF